MSTPPGGDRHATSGSPARPTRRPRRIRAQVAGRVAEELAYLRLMQGWGTRWRYVRGYLRVRIPCTRNSMEGGASVPRAATSLTSSVPDSPRIRLLCVAIGVPG